MDIGVDEGRSSETSTLQFGIECEPEVLEQIQNEVVTAFYALPRGGAECGGVLYGTVEESRILIRAARPAACEYALGPTFALSEKDLENFEKLVQAPQTDPSLAAYTVLGWYHSHSRSDISLSGPDLRIHKRFFPGPWRLAMVLKPAALKPTTVGFFLSDGEGTIRRLTCQLELNLPKAPARGPRTERPAAPERIPVELSPEPAVPEPDAPEALPAQPPAPTQAEAAPPAPEPAPPPRISSSAVPVFNELPEPPRLPGPRFWAAAALVALVVVAAAAIYFTRGLWGRSEGRQEPANLLRLRVMSKAGQLEIGWEGAPELLQQISGGTLEINDAGQQRTIPLDATFLRSGSVTYTRLSPMVVLHLAVKLRDGSQLERYSTFIGEQPLGAAVTPPPAQVPVQPPIPSPLPTATPLPVPTTQPVPTPPPAQAKPSPMPAPAPTVARTFTPPSSASQAQPQKSAVPAPPVAPGSSPANKTLPGPLAIHALAPPPPQTIPNLAGKWVYTASSPSASPFPAQAVTLSINQNGDHLSATYSARYKTTRKSGLKPNVRFEFQGAVHSRGGRYSWSADGQEGQVELIPLPDNDTLEVLWYTPDKKYVFNDVLSRAK